ncbi:MAG: hypothetical protein K6A73_02385 [Bacteroidales bacterium]|nr:hypothetical protein [Bacteroidales bacterium]
MPLTQKLQTINVPALKQVTKGNAATIADFWNCFVAPLLPNPQVVKDWFNLLNKFVDDADAVLAIRCYFSWKHPKLKDSDTLRRGFYNLTDKDYTFFYTDNFFAAYFAKMAIDGYVPSYNEFKQCMLSREFPARFGPSSSLERAQAAYSIDGKKGKDPGFCANGYKIAHIVDAGQDFCVAGQTMTIGDICEKYCDRGDYADWVLYSDQVGNFYARDLQMDQAAKDLLIAHFLRFACPMNYILTPGPYHHLLGVKIKYNDIAECEELQQYAMHKFYAIYGQDYVDFLKRILLPSSLLLTNLPSEITLGKKTIDITFDYKIKKTYTSVKITKTTKTMAKTVTKTSTRMISKVFLGNLKKMQSAGTLPHTVTTFINKTGYEAFLNSCPAINNGISTYLLSVEKNAFNDLLAHHGLPRNIYRCNDITKLVNVFDELVNNSTSSLASAALECGNQACRPALCYLLRYLLSQNGITV